MAKKLREVDSTNKYYAVNRETGAITTNGIKISELKEVDSYDQERFLFVYEHFVVESQKAKMVAKDLLLWMGVRMDTESNMISMNKRTRTLAGLSIGASPDSIKNSLREIVNAGWAIRSSRGEYCINPKYLWRGDRRVRSLAMQNFNKNNNVKRENNSIENFENDKINENER